MKEKHINELITASNKISTILAGAIWDSWINYKSKCINYWNNTKTTSENPLDSGFIKFLVNQNLSEDFAKKWLKSCLSHKWPYDNWIFVKWPNTNKEEFIFNRYTFLDNNSFLQVFYKILENNIEEYPEETAGDILLERIDDFFLNGNFTEVDNLINIIDINKLSIRMMVGLLSFTLAGKEELNNREKMVNDIEKRIILLDPNRADGLMKGLR
jgi:hypothetical protein